jgi:replicative DNA helicase
MIETLIFSQLLTNDEYARKVIPHLKDEYFSTKEERNFLKIYTRFFGKHNKIPSKQAMLLEIEKLKSDATVYATMVGFVNATEEFTESVDYLVDQTESFCKEKAIYNALRESVLIADGQSKDKNSEAIPSILAAALAVCFDTSVGHNYIDDAAARYEYYHLTTARVKTGIKKFDLITKGGFPKKTLNVFLAPPHGGKTRDMINVGVGAVKNGYNVLYITNEMAAEEIGRRYDVNMMDVDFETLDTLPKDTFNSRFKKMVTNSVEGKLVIKEYPTGTASAAHYRALLAELKTKQNFIPDMIIVDYMNICASEFYKAGTNHNSYTVVGSIGKELRSLAIESNTALITATQTNRTGVDNSDVDMTSISESAGTAMIADWILAIISTSELAELKQVMYKQIKNRYRGVALDEKFILGVDPAKLKIYDLDVDQSYTPAPKLNKGNKTNQPTQTSIDMEHKVTQTVSFDDFNFDE